MSRAPVTRQLAAFVSGLSYGDIPREVQDYTRLLVYDAIGTVYAALHPDVTSGALVSDFAVRQSGPEEATVIGRACKVSAVNAVLANGTLGYAVDFEPHHPEAILHPLAVMVPAALAVSEMTGNTGAEFMTAVALGCEITYRVSMAMGPRELYGRGFHPSAVCGTFGAAATAASLLHLDKEETVRAFGLAALQASGLMAWQDDPREDARPFQMGMAARNGLTAAFLAQSGFGAPDRIFDGGHVVLDAFSETAQSQLLIDGLGESWEGIAGLAIKPYSCVSFLHPALDALSSLLAEHRLNSEVITRIELRFARSGCHCVNDNPLKGHSAQYILPVFAASRRLSFIDLFQDRRITNPEVKRLADVTHVVPDTSEFESKFPDAYIGEVKLMLADGRELVRRADVARGYPELPLPKQEIEAKFVSIVSEVTHREHCEALAEAAYGVGYARSVYNLAKLLAMPSSRPDRN